MKLTNKILLSAFVIVLLVGTASSIYLKSKVELVPKIFDKEFVEITKNFSRINSLELIGNTNLIITKGEKDSLALFGPDLLLNKYYFVTESNGSLKIETPIDLSKYYYQPAQKLFVKNLSEIKLRNGAQVTSYILSGELLKVNAKDSSALRVSFSNFNNVEINALENTQVIFEKAKNITVRAKDKSKVLVFAEQGMIKKEKDKDAFLVINGKREN